MLGQPAAARCRGEGLAGAAGRTRAGPAGADGPPVASYTAHHVAPHTGEPYIAEQRKLERPILKDALVRTGEEPERLRPLREIMQRGEDGRWQQTAQLALGGGASILIALSDWVLEALDPPTSEAG